MTPADRKLLQQIARRADAVRRLAEALLQNDATLQPVMARGAGVLIRTLFLYCGEAIRADFLAWLLHTLREGNGQCICGALKDEHTDPLCAACMAEFDASDREVEQVMRMEEAPDTGARH